MTNKEAINKPILRRSGVRLPAVGDKQDHGTGFRGLILPLLKSIRSYANILQASSEKIFRAFLRADSI
jgi:hypothetical protein